MDEHETTITERCQAAVNRIAEAWPQHEVACLVRVGDILRHVAHAGRWRLIYEVARSQGGIAWRAAERGTTELVEDVREDPDYLEADHEICSELVVSVKVDGRVVAIIDVESAVAPLDEQDAELAEREAKRLAVELEPYFSRARGRVG